MACSCSAISSRAFSDSSSSKVPAVVFFSGERRRLAGGPRLLHLHVAPSGSGVDAGGLHVLPSMHREVTKEVETVSRHSQGLLSWPVEATRGFCETALVERASKVWPPREGVRVDGLGRGLL